MTSVDVVAGVLREADETWSKPHARAVAERVMDALAADGWRVVRTEPTHDCPRFIDSPGWPS